MVPKKPRVSSKADIKFFNEILNLFAKHGFGIAHFSDEGVSFYDDRAYSEHSVPVSSFYKMTKKEFLIFVDVLKRLEDQKKQNEEMVRFVNNII
jgi:hypothetical protein